MGGFDIKIMKPTLATAVATATILLISACRTQEAQPVDLKIACNAPLDNWMTRKKVEAFNEKAMWYYGHHDIPYKFGLDENGTIIMNDLPIGDEKLVSLLDKMNELYPRPNIILDFAEHPDCNRQNEVRKLIDANYECGNLMCYEGSWKSYLNEK